MTITLNGEPTQSGRLIEPRVGVWWVETTIHAEGAESIPPSGAVTLSFFDRLDLVGTVSAPRTVNDNGTISIRIEGGSGQLDQPLGVKHFHRTTLRRLVTALTDSTGDAIDTTADSALLERRVEHWSRPKTLAHRYLSDIAEKGGGVWRVLRNGNLWLGAETWPILEFDHTEETKLGSGNGMRISPGKVGGFETPLVRPGVTFKGAKVAEVVTEWTSKGISQNVSFEDSDAPGSHTRSVQVDADWNTRVFGTKLDLSAMYPCKVTRQTADLARADVLPDDDRIKGRGLQEVLIRYGMPGVKAKLTNHARVLLGWEAADPARPFLSLWGHGGIQYIAVEPEADVEIRLTATGTGKVVISSESTIEVASGDVRLGSAPGAKVATVGGVVAVSLPLMQAGPFPVVALPGVPSINKAVGQIVTGNAGGVKS